MGDDRLYQSKNIKQKANAQVENKFSLNAQKQSKIIKKVLTCVFNYLNYVAQNFVEQTFCHFNWKSWRSSIGRAADL